MAALALVVLTFGTGQAQDSKAKKKAEVAAAKQKVAASKAEMKTLRDKKNRDKVLGDKEAIRQDNIDLLNTKARLTSDQVKKDTKQVKSKM